MLDSKTVACASVEIALEYETSDASAGYPTTQQVPSACVSGYDMAGGQFGHVAVFLRCRNRSAENDLRALLIVPLP